MDHKPTVFPNQNHTTAVKPPAALTSAMVLEWLTANSDMIGNDPDFASVLGLIERDLGEGVIDFQHKRLEKLQETIFDLQQQNRKIIATVRQNYQIQARVHLAILKLVKASSFERLIELITLELSGILGLEAIGLCVEAGKTGLTAIPSSPYSKVRLVEVGVIHELLEGCSILLRADVTGDPVLFGDKADRVRSDALLLLDIGDSSQVAMLALGARRPGIFYPGQNTQLLQFFSEILSSSLRGKLKSDSD